MRARPTVAIVMLAAALGTAAPARADTDTVRPWATGVSVADQDAALAKFRDANERFGEAQFEEAVVLYLEALARWDHPSIRFNLAVSLIRLDRVVEADEHLAASLRYGAAPFEREELYQQAVDYQRLLEGRLARLLVRCPDSAATVSLDGQPLLTCPGELRHTLLPGAHELVAREPGHLTLVRALVLLPGVVTTEDVAPILLRDAARTERRWPAWLPWAVTAAGAGLVVAGGPLLASSEASYAEYDRAVDDECASGCEIANLPDRVTDHLDRGELQARLAVGAFVVGGLAVAAGVTMIVLNQPRSVLPDEDAGAPQPVIAPAPGGATIGVRLSF